MFTQKFFNCIALSLLFIGSVSTALASLDVTVTQLSPANNTFQVGGFIEYEIVVTNNTHKPLSNLVVTDEVTVATGFVKQGVVENLITLVFAKTADSKKFTVVANNNNNGFIATGKKKLDPGCSAAFFAIFKACGNFSIANIATATGECKGGKVFKGSSTPLVSTTDGSCALAASISPTVDTAVCTGGSVVLTANVTGACSTAQNLQYQWYTGTLVDPSNIIVGATLPQLTVAQGVFTVQIQDPVTGCIVSATSHEVKQVPCADLAITKQASISGNTVTYDITVTNNGNDGARFEVRDCVHDCLQVTNISADESFSTSYVVNSCSQGTSNCVIAEGFLEKGVQAKLRIVAQIVKSCGKKCVNNTATVTAYSGIFDCDLSNNSATASIKTCQKRK